MYFTGGISVLIALGNLVNWHPESSISHQSVDFEWVMIFPSLGQWVTFIISELVFHHCCKTIRNRK
jgi:hypothetical protein